MWALLVVGGLAALVIGAEALVRGASRIAAALGLPAIVIGLTLVAYGTSAPEFAVSVGAALSHRGHLALGNVIGSNIFNVLFILGVASIVRPLAVRADLVRRDVPILIVVSAGTWLLVSDGALGRWDGATLVVGALAYTFWTVFSARRREGALRAPDRVASGARTPMQGSAHSVGMWLRQALLVAAGLSLLVIGARWLVAGATDLAHRLGVSELVIGLTVVAAGTSLPELATSVIATLRGERDIAVGNVVGSNLFNLLGILGACALLAPEGIPVPAASLRLDIPLAVAAAAACLPVIFSGYQINRLEGFLFVASYAGYTLILSGVFGPLGPWAGLLIIAFLILVPLPPFLLQWRSLRRRGSGARD